MDKMNVHETKMRDEDHKKPFQSRQDDEICVSNYIEQPQTRYTNKYNIGSYDH